MIFWKTLADLCPCLKAELKSFELMSLADESPNQPSVDHVTQLLVTTLAHIYNEKGQSGQK